MNTPNEISVELPPLPYSVAVFLVHGEDGTVTTYSTSLLAYLRWLAVHPVPPDPGHVTLPTDIGLVNQTRNPGRSHRGRVGLLCRRPATGRQGRGGTLRARTVL